MERAATGERIISRSLRSSFWTLTMATFHRKSSPASFGRTLVEGKNEVLLSATASIVVPRLPIGSSLWVRTNQELFSDAGALKDSENMQITNAQSIGILDSSHADDTKQMMLVLQNLIVKETVSLNPAFDYTG